jgi:hypothetical protein
LALPAWLVVRVCGFVTLGKCPVAKSYWKPRVCVSPVGVVTADVKARFTWLTR